MIKYDKFVKLILKSNVKDLFNELTTSNKDFIKENFKSYSYILGETDNISEFSFITFLFYISQDYSRKEFLNKILEYVIKNQSKYNIYDVADIYSSVIKCGGYFPNNTDILISVCETYVDLYILNSEIENNSKLNIAYTKLFISYVKNKRYNDAKGIYLNSFSKGIKFQENMNFTNALKEMDANF
jgi:hypothetical protein